MIKKILAVILCVTSVLCLFTACKKHVKVFDSLQEAIESSDGVELKNQFAEYLQGDVVFRSVDDHTLGVDMIPVREIDESEEEINQALDSSEPMFKILLGDMLKRVSDIERLDGVFSVVNKEGKTLAKKEFYIKRYNGGPVDTLKDLFDAGIFDVLCVKMLKEHAAEQVTYRIKYVNENSILIEQHYEKELSDEERVVLQKAITTISAMEEKAMGGFLKLVNNIDRLNYTTRMIDMDNKVITEATNTVLKD